MDKNVKVILPEEEMWLEEISFLEACIECDDDLLFSIIQNGVTEQQINQTDESGKTGLSHACCNGCLPVIEVLSSLDEVDVNLSDKDGNTPLIFAAQAGHKDVVSFLLKNFPDVKVDKANTMGFTALLKAAIQGRTKIAKMLLFAGANPSRKDYGRKLCAVEWAKFCGRYACADAIQRYTNSPKYFIKNLFFFKEKFFSQPDSLDEIGHENANCSTERGKKTWSQSNSDDKINKKFENKRNSLCDTLLKDSMKDSFPEDEIHGTTKTEKESSKSWLKRHLSLKLEHKKVENDNRRRSSSLLLELQLTALTGSVPVLLNTTDASSDPADSSLHNLVDLYKRLKKRDIITINQIPSILISNED